MNHNGFSAPPIAKCNCVASQWRMSVLAARLGRAESELTRRRKGDKHKVALARQLRAETTMTLAWIAEHLRMGSWSYVSNLLRTTKSANSED